MIWLCKRVLTLELSLEVVVGVVTLGDICSLVEC